jgi:hypothetical protein
MAEITFPDFSGFSEKEQAKKRLKYAHDLMFKDENFTKDDSKVLYRILVEGHDVTIEEVDEMIEQFFTIV